MNKFDLEEYLKKGVEKIVSEIIKSTLQNPKESMFMMQYALDCKNAYKKRKISQQKGQHIPAFLIASITTKCNLHCIGCYARANHNCSDSIEIQQDMLSTRRWSEIFDEAEKIGISFILLAGGEPFLRRDVLKEASKHKKILFPIFTNGTMIDDDMVEFLDKNRNMIPVLSIEGDNKITDKRRGEGTYDKLVLSMQKLRDKKIVFACSITVTKNNINQILKNDYVDNLKCMGCRGIIYVEYVPVDFKTRVLALDDEARDHMMEKLSIVRKENQDMVFIAFPGDEKASNGCLAAGRGFFHINARGGAEPCPFSAHSDVNLKEISLVDALKSPLFMKLKENGNLENEHIGGCTLFEQEQIVKELIGGKNDN